ncbi:MAG TPA: metallopeptidase family protein [Anaerolineae bacterium]|nr:metallopeptidase family protein [Anaerolineae bacterium]
MTREEFEALVAEALADLPPEILERMDNVAVTVAYWPSPAQVARAGVRSPATLFGLYEGVPLTRRGINYGMVPPDRITLYQGPIEAACRTPSAMREQVRRTVVHEIAHHFGISDERLRELGY